jgi:hypothetical protein
MAYNIYYIEQINMSGSLTPALPYFVTEGDRNIEPSYYFETEEEAQAWINNQ